MVQKMSKSIFNEDICYKNVKNVESQMFQRFKKLCFLSDLITKISKINYYHSRMLKICHNFVIYQRPAPQISKFSFSWLCYKNIKIESEQRPLLQKC